MKNGKYLTRQDMGNFSEDFQKMYSKYSGISLDKTRVKNLTFIVTEDCNLDCTYCYEHGKNKNNKMNKKTITKAIDRFFEENFFANYVQFNEINGIILEFIGGEPTLEVDLMDYAIDYFRIKALQKKSILAYNYYISMSSNGILYRTKKMQQFVKKHGGRLSIGLTIDGNKRLHDACRLTKDGKGSYDIVSQSVKWWVKQFPGASTKVTLVPENIEYLVDSIIHLNSLGIKFIPANVVFEDVWDIKDARIYYKKLKELADRIIDNNLYTKVYTTLFDEYIGKPMMLSDDQNYCGGDGSMLAIGTKGQLYPCMRYAEFAMSTKGREPFIIGNIEDGVKNKRQCPMLQDLEDLTRSSQSTSECFNCSVASGCSWCTAFNYDVFGTVNKRAIFHCVMHKAQTLGNVYFWNKLYKKLNLDKNFEMHLNKEDALKIINNEEYNSLLKISEKKESKK